VRVYLHSLGCRLNWSEIEAMARRLTTAGHVLVDEPAQADVCIVNTCAVTAEAERKTRHTIRALYRANPQARIAVVGCAATLSPETFARFPGVAWVVTNEEKGEIVDRLSVPEGSEEAERQGGLRTRAFIKVQDGCDNHCTYCVVRILRGPGRSRPLEEVLPEVQERVEEGYQEVVVTGVNLGSYGRDRGVERGLYRLIEAILAHTDVPRLRLSSVEPWDLDETFFRLWENPRLCRQLHLPLQAGCDATLRRMGRPITTEQYAALVETARAAISDLALTTDVMVGFPGEDEGDFVESLAFVERIGFARLHVFPFSPRPGTPAARLPDQVPVSVRRERARRMREVGDRLAETFQQRFVGREMEVLWEHRRDDGLWHGLTDNYLRVVTLFGEGLTGRVVRTRLAALHSGLFIGEVVE